MDNIGHIEQELNQAEQKISHLLAITLAEYPERIRRLLRRYGIATSHLPDEKELIAKVWDAMATKGEDFQRGLGRLLAYHQPKQNNSHQEHESPDHRNPENSGQENNYVNLIMGAIAGIGNVAASIKGKKQKRAEARQKTLSALLTHKAQKEQKEAKKREQQQAKENKMKLIRNTGITVLLTTGVIAYKKLRPQIGPPN